MKAWRPRLMLVMAAVALLFFAACTSGGSDSEAFGFLPIPIRTPIPTITPLPQDVRAEICPDLPGSVLLVPGEHANLYETLVLDSAIDLLVVQDGGIDWVLGDDVERVLRLLDRDIRLESGTISQKPLFVVAIYYAQPGHEQCGPPTQLVEGLVNVQENTMGFLGLGSGQVPIPADFIDVVLSSISGVTPTLEPVPTRAPRTPRPTRTPVIVPDGAPFFEHPEDEELRWDGPDDRVSSRTRQHCAAPEVLTDEFGIPDLISVEDGTGYWAIAAVPPPPGLRWTGYHHDGWEIWQGENPKTIYVLHNDLDDIAFEYRDFGCI